MRSESINIRTLRAADGPLLLSFELANRDWFERHIEARDPAFYTAQGVDRHIAQYLDGYGKRTWHPCVLVAADGAIVGRANLKDIDLASRSAEVGYRIARHACGQGLATLAVRHLAGLARAEWQLSQLVANVYASNIGSAKVLGKCGFVRDPATAVHDGREEDDYRFVLKLRDVRR